MPTPLLVFSASPAVVVNRKKRTCKQQVGGAWRPCDVKKQLQPGRSYAILKDLDAVEQILQTIRREPRGYVEFAAWVSEIRWAVSHIL